jgi:hypothetical protein
MVSVKMANSSNSRFKNLIVHLFLDVKGLAQDSSCQAAPRRHQAGSVHPRAAGFRIVMMGCRCDRAERCDVRLSWRSRGGADLARTARFCSG